MSDVSNVCFRGKKSVWFDVSPILAYFARFQWRKCEFFPAAGMFMTVPVMAAESRLHTISVKGGYFVDSNVWG